MTGLSHSVVKSTLWIGSFLLPSAYRVPWPFQGARLKRPLLNADSHGTCIVNIFVLRAVAALA